MDDVGSQALGLAFSVCLGQQTFFLQEKPVLVDWVGENTSSVLQGAKVAGGGFSVGEVSPIRIGTETYDGLVVASGK